MSSLELSVWRMWWKRNGGSELRQLLMVEWDPIDVSDVPEAADEYDSYLGPIATRLRDGVSAEELADHLGTVRERMCLQPDEPVDLVTSQHIIDWYRESTARFPQS